MADKSQRYDDNSEGAFYVDMECIACDTCKAVAPKHFKLTDDYSHAIVFQQPTTEYEIAACIDAIDACPVDAIGHDT